MWRSIIKNRRKAGLRITELGGQRMKDAGDVAYLVRIPRRHGHIPTRAPRL